MDNMTKVERSKRMTLIRSKDTKPELLVRKLTHGLGFRFRRHDADLPGTPDIVFKTRRKVIFVNGCFWHLHQRCSNSRPPKSKLEYWLPKLEGNAKRDKLVRRRLQRLGWQQLVIWECQLGDREKLACKIKEFLEYKDTA